VCGGKLRADGAIPKAEGVGTIDFISDAHEAEHAMALAARKPDLYAELLSLPEHVVGQIVGGRLIAQPRPAPRHALAYSRLGSELGGPFDRGRGGPGGWWLLDEPEIHIGADVVVPDLAGWRRERMPALPETAWFESAPDWLAEVLSPSTARFDRAEKLPLYARWGVRHVWLIDPELRTLEVFENAAGRWVLLETLKDAEAVRQPPFEALEFPLSVLWADG
jgi:Uma2 family endonuclease